MNKLKYRLGLDVGTTSIGWAVIRLDQANQPCAIVKTGVRIFSDGRHPKTGASLAVDRRNARQARRRRDRLLKRKRRFAEGLVRFGLFPENKAEKQALTKLCPYELRSKGLQNKLNPYEIGRALFHLNQRRGFKSNRKTDTRDNDNSLMKSAIQQSKDRMHEAGCRTLGEWLFKRHNSGEPVRARLHGKTVKEKRYDLYIDRQMVLEEFEIFWEAQCSYHPDIMTAQARDYLYDTLQHQRELLPIRPGRCTLLPDEERAPMALPISQRFRILQELNNLRVTDSKINSRRLSLDERNVLYEELDRRKDIKFTTLARKIGLASNESFNLEDSKRDRLKGNLTASTLAGKKLLGDSWHSLEADKQHLVVDKLLNEISEVDLVCWLNEILGISDGIAEALANTQLPEGYGRLSLKALELIVPELEKSVVTYNEAVESAGLGSHSALLDMQVTGEMYDQLPYYGKVLQRHVAFAAPDPINEEQRYGKVANPTVHIALNQIRVVANALFNKYGCPTQINVEVTRELKQSVEQRRKQQSEQSERQKQNAVWLQEACDVLGLQPATLKGGRRRQLIDKMRLWHELRSSDSNIASCPFSGESISLTRLLGNGIEVEHILPFSRTLDDSLANKTLAITHANRVKTNLTPYEAFGQIPQKEYNYDEILERAALLPRNKRWRFSPEAMERYADEHSFLNRALNDTSYISRLARDYLSCCCKPEDVLAIPGRLTSMLRGKLGFSRLLSADASKNRNDHRHHAVDALVIALTDRALLQKVANENKKARSAGLNKLIEEMPVPFKSLLVQADRSINSVVVSHKPDHGYQAQMHLDTAWKPLHDGLARKRTRDSFSDRRVVVIEKKKLVRITEPTSQRHGFNEDGSPRAYKGYVGGSNYALEIFEDENGKWRGEVVTTYEAYQIVRQLGQSGGEARLRDKKQTQSGKALQLRLMINDCIRLTTEAGVGIYRVATIRAAGSVEFALHHEANVDARNRNKGLQINLWVKRAEANRI